MYSGYSHSQTYIATSVICAGSHHHHSFAHALTDCLPLYSVSHRYAVQRSFPLLNEHYNYVFDIILPLIGFTQPRIRTYQFVFAREAFLFDPISCDRSISLGHQKLRSVLASHFEIDVASPTKYVIIQRPVGYRHIDNFDELMSTIRVVWPSILWEQRPIATTFADDVKLMNSAQLLFGVHGAGMANTIFMQEGTVYSELFASHRNLMFSIMALATHKYLVCAANYSFGWQQVTFNYLQPSYFQKIIQTALSVLRKHQHLKASVDNRKSRLNNV